MQNVTSDDYTHVNSEQSTNFDQNDTDFTYNVVTLIIIIPHQKNLKLTVKRPKYFLASSYNIIQNI